ncbi:MAG TPA: hypothetical protein VGX68_28215 [Thermoanaerobaculia bacterium]|jgi:hypothetical protein|nr:hypothetical protein [Thermoanaerobaculia bacterium]
MGLFQRLCRASVGAQHAAPLPLLLLLGLTACGGDASSGSGTAPGAQPNKEPAVPKLSAAPEVGIELRRGREPRELARIGTRGVTIGPEGGPLAWKLFAEPRRADDAWYFFRVFAPFTMKSPAGDLAFRGHGQVKPGPAERRMILEWARQVATEAAGGRGGAAYGLVLAWHQGGPAGLCEDVVLYLTGEAVATGCGWEREVVGRLDPGPLGQVYEWFDRFQPFQMGGDERDESPRSGKLQVRLIFAGHGSRFTKPAEQREILSFAAALFGELAARRRGAIATAVPTAPGPPPAAPASRLLIPPGAGLRSQGILLDLPERPPPVPRPSPPRASSPAPSPPTTPGEEGIPMPLSISR